LRPHQVLCRAGRATQDSITRVCQRTDGQTDRLHHSHFFCYFGERDSVWMTTGRQTGLRSEAQRAGLRKLPGETVGARKPLHAATREEHSIKRMHCPRTGQWLLLSTLTTAIAKSAKVRGKADPMSTTLLRATRIIASGARARPTACLYTLPLANWQRGGLSRRPLAPLAMQVVRTSVPFPPALPLA